MKAEELEQVSRKLAKHIHLSEHGKTEKAGLWICGDILLPSGKQANCSECGNVCYYDDELKTHMKKNHKKICIKCAYENHKEDMSALEQDIIKKMADKK